MASRSDQILDVAERDMRKGGPEAVSFRDIATQIGIKSASVHYHFPTKQDLTAAVTHRYATRFLASLGRPDDPSESPMPRIQRLADAYISAFEKDASTCLCTVLGSVTSTLPDAAQQEIATFFASLEQWTACAMAGHAHPLPPNMVVALLQGAMVLSLANGSTAPLRDARGVLAPDTVAAG